MKKKVTKSDLKIGQTIYLKSLGNNARNNNREIRESKIKKIGNKFFELEDFRSSRFFISTLTQDGKGYSPWWQCYLSREEIEIEKEINNLIYEIRKYFRDSSTKNISLEDLRVIKKIIDICRSVHISNRKSQFTQGVRSFIEACLISRIMRKVSVLKRENTVISFRRATKEFNLAMENH